jgi:H+-transporting ATPase
MKAHADHPKAPGAKADAPDGLTQAEAQKRLTEFGPNEIPEKKTNAILKFLSYFWGPIPWMIEAAVILSAGAGHWPDFGIILLLLLANGVVGFWEEHQAGNAIAALKATLAIRARVKRDGKWVNPAARELVPGDAIRLRLGDIAPADARFLDGDDISVDQSALTGESLPATRKSGEAIFSGSIVRRGEIAKTAARGGTARRRHGRCSVVSAKCRRVRRPLEESRSFLAPRRVSPPEPIP